MATFFPQPYKSTIASGIESLSFECEGTEVLISSIAPGATLKQHQHPEAQAGMAIAGRFELEVDGKVKILEALRRAYVVDPFVFHRAANTSSETAVGLDIKRLCPETENHAKDETFLSLTKQRKFKTGLAVRFFVGPWFEMMISTLPPGAEMPVHQHKQEQLGVALKGKYVMTVANEEQEFKYGDVYYAPSNVPHGGHNPFQEEACSVNIFFPPRYHRASRWREINGFRISREDSLSHRR